MLDTDTLWERAGPAFIALQIGGLVEMRISLSSMTSMANGPRFHPMWRLEKVPEAAVDGT